MVFFKNLFIKRNLKKDMLMVIILVVLPFVFFAYRLLPETQVWSNRFFAFDSGYFANVKLFAWMLFLKIMTVIVLSLWFLTCKHKWRYILFVPIIAEIYKVYLWFKVIDLDYDYIPEFYESCLYSIPYLAFLLFISKALGYYKNSSFYNNRLNKEINEEIIKLSYFDTKNYRFVRKELIQLINEKENIPKREYLSRLIALRDQISI